MGISERFGWLLGKIITISSFFHWRIYNVLGAVFLIIGFLIIAKVIPHDPYFIGGATVIGLGFVFYAEDRIMLVELDKARKDYKKKLALLKKKQAKKK